MKATVAIISVLVINLACSHNFKLSNRYFECSDSNKVNSFNFINDTICIYKQEFLFDMPKAYKELAIKCSYKNERNRLILKNLSENKDSLEVTCFCIPEEVLNQIDFFQTDTLSSKYIYAGAPPTFSKIDIYGYLDNITIDTLLVSRHKIVYSKWNECYKYYMFISQRFKELKKIK